MSFWTGTHWEQDVPAQAPHRGMPRFIAAVVEATLVAAIIAMVALAFSPVSRPASQLANVGVAQARSMGTIRVTFGSTTTATDARVFMNDGSKFSSDGCGFRARSDDYYMVVRGPAPDTDGLAYWVDPFPVDGTGCGSATVSWTSSGVPGDFEVYVVRSASGNPWQASPASNTVTVTIVNP